MQKASLLLTLHFRSNISENEQFLNCRKKHSKLIVKTSIEEGSAAGRRHFAGVDSSSFEQTLRRFEDNVLMSGDNSQLSSTKSTQVHK